MDWVQKIEMSGEGSLSVPKKETFSKKSQPANEPLFFLEDFWEPIEFWLLWYRIKVALANMFWSFIQTLNEAKNDSS